MFIQHLNQFSKYDNQNKHYNQYSEDNINQEPVHIKVIFYLILNFYIILLIELGFKIVNSQKYKSSTHNTDQFFLK